MRPSRTWYKAIERSARRRPGVIGVVCSLLLWIAVSKWKMIGPTLVASPIEVARVLKQSAIGRISQEENIFIQVSATIARVLIGWVLSLVAGVLLGAVLGVATRIYQTCEPILEFVRSIPPIMVFPLFLVAFNYGEQAYLFTIIFGCIPLIALTVARGFQQMSYVRLEILTMFRVPKRVRVLARFMEVLPSGVLAARLAFSICIIVAVVSEMVFTPRNDLAIGSLAKQAEMAFHTPVFFAALLVIGIVGYAGNLGIRKCEERLGFVKERNISDRSQE